MKRVFFLLAVVLVVPMLMADVAPGPGCSCGPPNNDGPGGAEGE